MSLVPPLVGLCVIVAACAVLALLGRRRFRARRALIRDGVPIRAVIVAVRPQSVDSTWACHPLVRCPFGGRSWESAPTSGQHMLTPQGWKTAQTGGQFIGQSLDVVVVDPQDPARSAVPTRDRSGTTMMVRGLVFGGLVPIIGLIGVIAGVILQQ